MMRRNYICLIASLLFILFLNGYAQETPPDSAATDTNSFVSDVARIVSETRPIITWPLLLGKIIWSLAILTIGLALITYIIRPLRALTEKLAYMRLVIPLVKIFFWIFVSYVILIGVFSPSDAMIIVLLGTAGLSLALALKHLFVNSIAGLQLYFDQPFKVGDWIKCGEISGKVSRIGLKSTQLITADNNRVIIPNGQLVSNAVFNTSSGSSVGRVIFDFFFPPDIDIDRTKDLIYRSASVSRYVYLNEPVRITVKNEVHDGRSLLRFTVNAFVLDISFEKMFTSDVTELVFKELLNQGVLTPEALASSRLEDHV